MRSMVERSVGARLLHALLVIAGAGVSTTALFLVLPLLEAIAVAPAEELLVTEVGVADVPPPPPPPAPEEEPEPEESEPPPPSTDLTEEAPPLDLAELELALAPVGGAGWGGADFGARLGALAVAGPTAKEESQADQLFALADLDQQPRAVYQPTPTLNADMRARLPRKVLVVFVVSTEGRVEEPKVQSSTDPIFERAALSAVKQWKFEPGKRQGQPVRFRMRVPISF